MSKEQDLDSPGNIGPHGKPWALILGSSKGLGLATARKLANSGYGILAVHRDLKTDLKDIEEEFDNIRTFGNPFISFNADAIQDEKRKELLQLISETLHPDQKISVVVHSIAKGHLKPMYGDLRSSLSGKDLQLTIDAMAISLYNWIRELLQMKLLSNDTRIIAFTSEGSSRALPYYGAVSAAKSTLESIVRSIALEFASLGIKANCIQAGVTDTESFRRIPNSDRIREIALKRNPNKRLTKPEDVANAVYLLCREEAKWITGTVLKVDGGESLM